MDREPGESASVAGNNVRLMVVGSAPVADHVISFMRVALGTELSQGCY